MNMSFYIPPIIVYIRNGKSNLPKSRKSETEIGAPLLFSGYSVCTQLLVLHIFLFMFSVLQCLVLLCFMSVFCVFQLPLFSNCDGWVHVAIKFLDSCIFYINESGFWLLREPGFQSNDCIVTSAGIGWSCRQIMKPRLSLCDLVIA